MLNWLQLRDALAHYNKKKRVGIPFIVKLSKHPFSLALVLYGPENLIIICHTQFFQLLESN